MDTIITQDQICHIIANGAAMHLTYQMRERKKIEVWACGTWDSRERRIGVEVKWPEEMYPDAPPVGGLLAMGGCTSPQARYTTYSAVVTAYQFEDEGRLGLRLSGDRLLSTYGPADDEDDVTPAPGDACHDRLISIFFEDGIAYMLMGIGMVLDDSEA